jgi:hypothetical protein
LLKEIDMRKLAVAYILLLMALPTIICGQNKSYYPSIQKSYIPYVNLYSNNKYSLGINLSNQQFELYQTKNESKVQLSLGEARRDKSVLVCVDKKTQVKSIFEMTDKYQLKVVLGNKYLKKNEILYLTETIDQSGEPIEQIGWKNGKLHGMWTVFGLTGIKTTIYKNGKIVSTQFQSWQEIHSNQMVD